MSQHSLFAGEVIVHDLAWSVGVLIVSLFPKAFGRINTRDECRCNANTATRDVSCDVGFGLYKEHVTHTCRCAARSHAYTHTHTHARTHALIHATPTPRLLTHAHTYTRRHTRTHTHRDTDRQTHTHTHTNTH